jgi:hypothetical protein
VACWCTTWGNREGEKQGGGLRRRGRAVEGRGEQGRCSSTRQRSPGPCDGSRKTGKSGTVNRSGPKMPRPACARGLTGIDGPVVRFRDGRVPLRLTGQPRAERRTDKQARCGGSGRGREREEGERASEEKGSRVGMAPAWQWPPRPCRPCRRLPPPPHQSTEARPSRPSEAPLAGPAWPCGRASLA